MRAKHEKSVISNIQAVAEVIARIDEMQGLMDRMGHWKNVFGVRHGKLVGLCRTAHYSSARTRKWLCVCDCGKYCLLTRAAFQMQQSCGCLMSENGSVRGEVCTSCGNPRADVPHQLCRECWSRKVRERGRFRTKTLTDDYVKLLLKESGWVGKIPESIIAARREYIFNCRVLKTLKKELDQWQKV